MQAKGDVAVNASTVLAYSPSVSVYFCMLVCVMNFDIVSCSYARCYLVLHKIQYSSYYIYYGNKRIVMTMCLCNLRIIVGKW